MSLTVTLFFQLVMLMPAVEKLDGSAVLTVLKPRPSQPPLRVNLWADQVVKTDPSSEMPVVVLKSDPFSIQMVPSTVGWVVVKIVNRAAILACDVVQPLPPLTGNPTAAGHQIGSPELMIACAALDPSGTLLP